MRSLPERMRLARNIRIGDEILITGTWYEVVDELWVTEPLDVITFILADATFATFTPSGAQVMSRRKATT